MKPYFFSMTICSKRTMENIGKRVGIVYANDEGEAFQAAWNRFGSDFAFDLWVQEIPEEGYFFTIYKGAI